MPAKRRFGEAWAEDWRDGVLLNPSLPEAFDCTPHLYRPKAHRQWWGVPYVETEGGRFAVKCLDGQERTAPSVWAAFVTFPEAVEFARWSALPLFDGYQ